MSCHLNKRRSPNSFLRKVQTRPANPLSSLQGPSRFSRLRRPLQRPIMIRAIEAKDSPAFRRPPFPVQVLRPEGCLPWMVFGIRRKRFFRSAKTSATGSFSRFLSITGSASRSASPSNGRISPKSPSRYPGSCAQRRPPGGKSSRRRSRPQAPSPARAPAQPRVKPPAHRDSVHLVAGWFGDNETTSLATYSQEFPDEKNVISDGFGRRGIFGK